MNELARAPAGSTDRADRGSLRIEAMRPADWPAVAAIYAEGIATGDATFETAPPTWERFDHGHLAEHRLVARVAPPQLDRPDGHLPREHRQPGAAPSLPLPRGRGPRTHRAT